MFKKIILFWMVISLLIQPAIVFADQITLPQLPPLQNGEQQIGEVISPLRKTQQAPFTGLLLSPAAVAKLVVELNNEQAKIDLEVKKAKDTQAAIDQLTIDDLNSQIQYIKTTTAVQIKTRDDEISLLTKKLQDVENSKPNLPLWIGVGAVGGIVLTVVTVFAVSKATK